jgi:hypothetical protein
VKVLKNLFEEAAKQSTIKDNKRKEKGFITREKKQDKRYIL